MIWLRVMWVPPTGLGMARFAFLQRSTLVAWTGETLTFWCQKGNRASFFWRTRAGLDLLPPLQNELWRMCASVSEQLLLALRHVVTAVTAGYKKLALPV